MSGLGPATLKLAWKTYHALSTLENSQNLILSPASIHAALSMTCNGIDGVGQKELTDFLETTKREANQYWRQSLSQLESSSELSIASKLYVANDAPIRSSFLEATEASYNAKAVGMSFAQPDAARKSINHWVEEITNGKISDLIAEDAITTETLALLVNALHFKAGWQHEFPEKNTTSGQFQTYDNRSVNAAYMQDTFFTPYFGTDEFDAIELPYKTRAYSMLLYVPKGKLSLPEAEARLGAEQWERLLKKLKHSNIALSLPKFSASSSLDLKSLLVNQDVTTIFRNGLNKVFEEEVVPIGKVLHRAELEVNERGAEAAAATAAIVAAGIPPTPIQVDVDRAFLFMIRDNKSGVIVMNGRIGEPSTMDSNKTKITPSKNTTAPGESNNSSISKDEREKLAIALDLVIRKRRTMFWGYMVALVTAILGALVAVVIYGTAEEGAFINWVLLLPFLFAGVPLFLFGRWSRKLMPRRFEDL